MALTYRRFGSVAGLTFFSRLTGFVNVLLLGASLGLTPLADAFARANVLPNILYEFVLGGLVGSVFLPLFIRQKSEKSEEEFQHEISSLISTLLTWLAIITVIAAAASPLFVRLLALKEGDPEVNRQATWLFRFFAFQIFFYGLGGLCGALLHAHRRFIVVAVAPVINNLVVAATLLLYMLLPQAQFGKIGLALGVTGGVASMALIQVLALTKAGWNWGRVFRPQLWHHLLGRALKLGLPLIALIGIQQGALTVRANLAAEIEAGFAALQYAYRFFQLPYGILAVTITTLLMPDLAERAAKGDARELATIFRRGLKWHIALLFPAAVVYALLSGPLMQLFMARGELTPEDAALIGRLLFFYALGVFSFSLLQLATRFFYALEETTNALWLLGSVALISIPLCILLAGVADLQGIVFAMLISYSIGAVAGILAVRRKLESLANTA